MAFALRPVFRSAMRSGHRQHNRLRRRRRCRARGRRIHSPHRPLRARPHLRQDRRISPGCCLPLLLAPRLLSHRRHLWSSRGRRLWRRRCHALSFPHPAGDCGQRSWFCSWVSAVADSITFPRVGRVCPWSPFQCPRRNRIPLPRLCQRRHLLPLRSLPPPPWRQDQSPRPPSR